MALPSHDWHTRKPKIFEGFNFCSSENFLLIEIVVVKLPSMHYICYELEILYEKVIFCSLAQTHEICKNFNHENGACTRNLSIGTGISMAPILNFCVL